MNIDLMIESLPKLLLGSLTTLKLLGGSLFFGFLLAVPLTFMSISQHITLRVPARSYIYFFRGTPALVQIFLIYYGLAQFDAVKASIFWPLLRQPMVCALLTLSLHTAAYTAVILRGAIEAVPSGQIEAAKAAGMSRFSTYRRIIFPQALLFALPAYGNEVISMMKATSLASTITIIELTDVSKTIVSQTFKPYEVFITATLIYLTIAYVLSHIVLSLEKRLSRHMRPMPETLSVQNKDVVTNYGS